MTIHLYQKFLGDGALQLSPSSSAKSSVTNNDLLEPFPRPRSPFLASISTFLKFPFWVKQRLLLKTNRHFGQVENADISDIANVFSPTFINPTFRYSPVVKYEKLDV